METSTPKGNMGNAQQKVNSQSNGGDRGESSGIEAIRVEKGTEVDKVPARELVRANHGQLRSVGSRFSRLEEIEELECDEMEIEDREAVKADV